MVALLVFCCIFFTTIGQLLFKVGSGNKRLLTNYYTILGYGCFLLVMCAVYLLMHRIDFKYITTIMSFNYVSVLITSGIVLKEPLNKMKVLGTAMVTVGIVIFVW